MRVVVFPFSITLCINQASLVAVAFFGDGNLITFLCQSTPHYGGKQHTQKRALITKRVLELRPRFPVAPMRVATCASRIRLLPFSSSETFPCKTISYFHATSAMRSVDLLRA